MSMLKINGVTIPTAKGGSVNYKDIGDPDGVAFDGTAIVDIRNRKRQWKFKTKPLNFKDAQMYRGLIRGDGYFFNFDSDVYSVGGKPANSSSVYSRPASTAADGKNVYFNINGASAAPAITKNGAGSAWVDQGGANYLTAALAAPTTAWGNATLDTTNYFVGTASNKLPATTNQYANPVMSWLTGEVVIYSFFAYSNGGASGPITAYITGTNLPSTNFVFTLPAGGWNFFQMAITATGAGSNPAVYLYNGLTNPINTGGITVTKSPSGGSYGATYYIPGGATRAFGQLSYPINPLKTNNSNFSIDQPNPSGLTINLWCAPNASSPGANYCMACLCDGTADYRNTIYLLSNGIGQNAFIVWYDSAQNTSNVAGGATLSAAWNLLTMVIDFSPINGGSPTATLYVNGVAGSTVNFPASAFNLSAMSTLFIASGAGLAEMAGSPVDEVSVLPYPVTPTWVTQKYAASPDVGPPVMLASGLAFENPYQPVPVQGKVTSVSYTGFHDPVNGWQPNGEVLEFTLREI